MAPCLLGLLFSPCLFHCPSGNVLPMPLILPPRSGLRRSGPGVKHPTHTCLFQIALLEDGIVLLPIHCPVAAIGDGNMCTASHEDGIVSPESFRRTGLIGFQRADQYVVDQSHLPEEWSVEMLKTAVPFLFSTEGFGMRSPVIPLCRARIETINLMAEQRNWQSHPRHYMTRYITC